MRHTVATMTVNGHQAGCACPLCAARREDLRDAAEAFGALGRHVPAQAVPTPQPHGNTGVRMTGRKHAPAKVGDTFGPYTVIALAQRDYASNERVRVRCVGGHEKTACVFNLRKATTCRACSQANGAWGHAPVPGDQR